MKIENLNIFFFWFIIIGGAWWYFEVYKPAHPPQPTAEEIRFKEERAYKEAHPEENENLAILAAKYKVNIESVQGVINGYDSFDRDKNKNKQIVSSVR